MKYLMLGLGLMALLLCSSLFVLWRTACCLDEVAAPLHTVQALLEEEDYESILALTEESQSLWESHRGYFCSIFSHAELEDIDQGYASLIAYAEQEELAELRDAHRRLLERMEHLRRMDLPYYYNILTGFFRLCFDP